VCCNKGSNFNGRNPALTKEQSKVDKVHMDAIVALWRKGDEDLEPSTKMMALVEYLKEWDASGDKTICFSQCQCSFLCDYSHVLCQNLIRGAICRDLDVGPCRDTVFATGHQKSEI